MNPTEFPSLNKAVSDFVFQENESREVDIDHKALEIACIDLISKLENLMAKAREMPRDDFIDEAGSIATKMINRLSTFGNDFFQGNAAAQAREENARALTFCHAYDEVLKTRPLSNAIIRTFWNVDEIEEIKIAHAQLGEAMVRACAATFYHAVMLVGLENAFGQQIDQSTVVFVNELKQHWN